jgi:hypothetical protein
MNYAQIAGAVYQRCNHFDPYLPPLSTDLARAWGTLFEKHRLHEADLLNAVDVVYDEHGTPYRPLPHDIVAAARAIRRERAEREDDAQRRAREDAQDAALEARNKARLGQIADTIATARSIDRPRQNVSPPRRFDGSCGRLEAVKNARRAAPATIIITAEHDPLLCGICGQRELVAKPETDRGVCDRCWPTIHGHGHSGGRRGDTA